MCCGKCKPRVDDDDLDMPDIGDLQEEDEVSIMWLSDNQSLNSVFLSTEWPLDAAVHLSRIAASSGVNSGETLS